LNKIKHEAVHEARLSKDFIIDVEASRIWSAKFNQVLSDVFELGSIKSELGYSYIHDIHINPFTFIMMCALQVIFFLNKII
jgi:hypothetical protein